MQHAFARFILPGPATLVAGVAAVAGAALPAAAATPAHASHSLLYVSKHSSARATDSSCTSAAFGSIGSAVSAVATGGTVVVCAGTYNEDVHITKSLTLVGSSGHPVVNAAGRINGVLVTGSHVTVAGLTITGAIGEGVLVNHANHVTIKGNVVDGNDLGGLPVDPVKNSYAECQAQGGIPGDCGEGIHFMGASDSTITGNISTGNSGGILLSDETGPTAHNAITDNLVTDNLYDCGITVVGHNPAAAPKGKPAPKVAGVYANLVKGNTISGNGIKGGGAGVVMATGLPGGAVYDNTVEGNTISGNGMSGVTVHSHTPGQYLNGNVITGNVITVNNLDGDFDFAPHVDTQTTGVLVATVTPLSITITGNEIAGDHFGIWTTGPVTAKNDNDNRFAGDAIAVAKG